MLIEPQTHLTPALDLETPLIICPGFHDPAWTDAFLQNINFPAAHPIWLFPTEKYPACSGMHLLNFMQDCAGCNAQRRLGDPHTPPPILISFSAGVVGAMQAAWVWQQLGGQIAAILAIDGWGVPLVNEIPCYRLSHDRFTHWSSALLGPGRDSFYAMPDVTHAELWKNPQQVKGWRTDQGSETQTPITAAAFIQEIVLRHRMFAP
jgi:hypothetical protein